MIKLIEETHKYVNDQYPKIEYTSVTTIIGKYHEKFNEDFYATKVAERRGITKQEVINEWREINRQANEYGTAFHAIMERYLLAPDRLYSARDEFEKIAINAFRKMCDENRLNMWKSPTLRPEHIMSLEFSELHGIAGTSDIIEDLSNDMFNVWDFKTNKEFNYESKYEDYLHFPVQHLSHCHYNEYSLQLSIYGVMYERQTGRKFNRAGLFYWDKIAQAFSFIPVPFMKKEAELMIEHFKMSLGY